MGYTDVIISQPSGGNWLALKHMIGHRVVVFGTHSITEEPDPMNQGRTRNVAVVDFADLDDGAGGKIQWKAKVDKPGFVNKLDVDQRTAVLGRIELGDAKAGQNAPFILGTHQPGDAEFFMNVWLPANRDALAGKAPQPENSSPQQTPAPAPAASAPEPATSQPTLPVAPAAPPNIDPAAFEAFQKLMASGQISVPS